MEYIENIPRYVHGPRDDQTKWSQPESNIIWHRLYVEPKKTKKKMTQMSLFMK